MTHSDIIREYIEVGRKIVTANFQLALAKNRENYQSNIQRLKDIHKGDLKAKDEKHLFEMKNLQSESLLS